MGDAVDDALALLAQSMGVVPEERPSVSASEDGELSDIEPLPKRHTGRQDVRDKAQGRSLRADDRKAARRSDKAPREPRDADPVVRQPKVPCRYYMEGRCTKGAACTFSHAVKPNKTAAEARSAEPCRFLIAGHCLRGDECLYSHDLSRVPCRHLHVRGDCPASRAPGGCRFSHAPIGEDERRALFAESMGTRDPRLASAPASGRAAEAFVYVPKAPRTRPPDAIVQRYAHGMDPYVAALDPFGSPFARAE